MKLAIVDTMFSRGDMGSVAVKVIENYAKEKKLKIKLVRRTVPGVKDIPLALLNLLEEGCHGGIAFGMPGRMPIDKQCSHEASLGIAQVQLITRKIVLECFVHEDEGRNDEELGKIMHNRASKHSLNLMWMIFEQAELAKRAGCGERQGKENAKPVILTPGDGR